MPPAKRFSHIHIDIVGPLPPSSGFTHLLTIMDRTTRSPEAIPLRDTTTTECARALISTWIARFGVPLDMTSDRVTSVMWSTISSQLGILLHRTTAYHPQANGLVERFHRTLKASLKAQLLSLNWVDELPWVLLGIRVVPKDDLRTSSAELVYGEPLMIPGNFTSSNSTPWDATNLVRQKNLPISTSAHKTPSGYVPTALRNAKYVCVRLDAHHKPLQNPYKTLIMGQTK